MENLNYDEHHKKITNVFESYNIDLLLYDAYDNFELALNNYNQQREIFIEKIEEKKVDINFEITEKDKDAYRNELKKYVDSMNNLMNKIFLSYKMGNFHLYNNFSSVDDSINEIAFLWKNIKKIKFYKVKDFEDFKNYDFIINGECPVFYEKSVGDYTDKIRKLSDGDDKMNSKIRHQGICMETNFDILFEHVKNIFQYVTTKRTDINYESIALNALNILINNFRKIHHANVKVVEDISEFEHERITKVINSIKKNYGLNILLNSNLLLGGEKKDFIKDEDIEDIDIGKMYLYLKGIELQSKLIKNIDKSADILLSKVPAFVGQYFPTDGLAMVTYFNGKLIDESAGIILLKGINNNYTIFAHEYEHLKDSYILNKVSLGLGKEQKKEKEFFENMRFKFLSEYYMNNLVSKIVDGKDLLSNIEDGIVKDAFALTFEKQDYYYFDHEKNRGKDIQFSNKQYDLLRDKLNLILAKEIISEFIQLEVNFSENESSILLNKIRNDRVLTENLLLATKESLSKTLAVDILINDIKNKEDRKPVIDNSGGLSSIGKFGGKNSSFLLLKTLQNCLIEMFDTIPKITNQILVKNQNEKERYIQEMSNNILGLKTTIKMRQIIDEYPDVEIPKYYATNGSCQGFSLNEEVLSNNIKRIFTHMNEVKSEYTNYLASPTEIYARNAQSLVSKKFINKKNNGFVENANKVTMIKVANKIENLYSSEKRKQINIGRKYPTYLFSSLNMFIEELSDKNLERIEEINESLMDLIKQSDTAELNFKIKDTAVMKPITITERFKELMDEVKSVKRKTKKVANQM